MNDVDTKCEEDCALLSIDLKKKRGGINFEMTSPSMSTILLHRRGTSIFNVAAD